MGLCISKTEATSTTKPVTEVTKPVQFINVTEILKESSTSAAFRAWLKTKNHQWKELEIHPVDYFTFYEQTEKRISIFKSGQRCGDDKEKGIDILAQWARDIVTSFGSLKFYMNGLVSELKDANLDLDNGGPDLFKEYATVTIVMLQEFLDHTNKN
ncbi:hypothetical protein HDV02_000386 [Globomyces sp. JEL0801]|nr:hypothetical protein HDV02_000386 [Globomyces sp. JEL0801]